MTVVEPRKLTPIVLEAGSGRQWPVEPASALPAADPQPVRAATTQILSPPLPLLSTVPPYLTCVPVFYLYSAGAPSLHHDCVVYSD